MVLLHTVNPEMATAKLLLLWSVLVAAIVHGTCQATVQDFVPFASEFDASSVTFLFFFFFLTWLEISEAHIQEGSNFNSEIHQVHLAKTMFSVILCNQPPLGEGIRA